MSPYLHTKDHTNRAWTRSKESEWFKQLLLGEDKFKDAMHFFCKRGHLDEAEE